MIKCDVTGRNFEVEDRLKDYVDEKIGGLERYVPKTARPAAHATVVLSDDPNGREDNRYVCDVVLKVPGAELVSREGTVNIYAAVDIVEAKLRSQLETYKDKTAMAPRRGQMLSRWLGRRGVRPEPDASATEE